MISGPVMIQVLEGENAIAKNRELMGATDPKKADAGHHPRRLRRQHRRQRRARLRRRRDRRGRDRVLLPRHERLHAAEPASSPAMTVNLLEFDLRRAGRVLRAAGREALSRDPAVPLDPPARRARLRARCPTWPSRCATSSAGARRGRGRCRSRASRLAPTARSSGCSTSATATRSRPSSSPRTTAARCASRRRPAAPSAAASAPPATRASAAT